MSQVILVVGRSGEGKSFLVSELLSKSNKTVYILDRMVKANKGSDYKFTKRFSDFGEFAEWFVDNNQEEKEVVSLQFSAEYDWGYALELLYNQEDYILVVEEASFYMSPNAIVEPLEALLRAHRNKQITIFLISHRPVDFQLLVISFASTVIAFKEEYGPNLERLAKITFVGQEAFKLPELKVKGIDESTGKPYTEYRIFGDKIRL
jgi:DNA helicase HerA-like ATPase